MSALMTNVNVCCLDASFSISRAVTAVILKWCFAHLSALLPTPQSNPLHVAAQASSLSKSNSCSHIKAPELHRSLLLYRSWWLRAKISLKSLDASKVEEGSPGFLDILLHGTWGKKVSAPPITQILPLSVASLYFDDVFLPWTWGRVLIAASVSNQTTCLISSWPVCSIISCSSVHGE